MRLRKPASPADLEQEDILHIEALEERQMLSAVTGFEGAYLSASLTLEGSSTSSNFDLQIDLGDGSYPIYLSDVKVDDNGAGGAAFNTGEVDLIYADDGQFSATYSLFEDGVMVDSASQDFSIENVAPIIQLSGERNLLETGLAYTIEFDVIDPGQDSIQTWMVDWGDGSPVEAVSGSLSTASHIYATEGQFTINAAATDEDGTYAAVGVTLDSTFGDHGMVVSDFFGKDDKVGGMTVQGDGKVVVAGTVATQETVLPGGADLDFNVSSITTGRKLYEGGQFYAVDADDSYRISAVVSSGDGAGGLINPVARTYLGYKTYDIDKKFISPYHVLKGAGVDTRLAVDLVNGATEIVLEDGTDWYNGSTKHRRTLAWYGYADSTGHVYDDYTYTRNYVYDAWNEGDVNGNVITLRNPWSRGTVAAGTAIRNTKASATYNYALLNYQSVPESPTEYSAVIGNHRSGHVGFRPATRYIRPLMLANWNNVSGNQVNVSDFRIDPIQEYEHNNIGLRRYNVDGTPDSSFGEGGYVTTDLYHPTYTIDYGHAIQLQNDGKIVVAGKQETSDQSHNFVVLRYHQDGSLDTSFGEQGVASLDVLTTDGGSLVSDDFASSLTIANEKIVVAGRTQAENQAGTDWDYSIVRFNLDGTLDSSFGNDGVTVVDFDGDSDFASSVAVQSDGRVLVAGHASLGSADGGQNIAVIRLAADGTLDPTFGADGSGQVSFSTNSTRAEGAFDILLNDDDSFFLTGYGQPGSLQNEFLVIAYDPNGQLDSSFGVNGVAAVDFGGDDYGLTGQRLSDGSIVIAGYLNRTISGESDAQRIAVAKLTPSGVPDASFGDGGLTEVVFASNFEKGIDTTIGHDGSVYVVGEVRQQGSNADLDWGLAKLLPSNQLTVRSNEIPLGTTDHYQVDHDRALVVDVEHGVLKNDFDLDGDLLVSSVVVDPNHGTLTLNLDGSFEYLPGAGFVGTDQFSYELFDGIATSDPVLVEISVVNSVPDTATDAYIVGANSTLSIPVDQGLGANDLDINGDAISFVVNTGPINGSLVLQPDGAFEYTPTTNFVGEDSFTYVANDGLGVSEATTVTILVHNDPPLAIDDVFWVSHDQALSVDDVEGVLANDLDSESNSHYASLVSDVQHGSLTLNVDGEFTYLPEAGFVGEDSFIYSVFDGLQSDEATVTIHVTNAEPIGRSDSYVTGFNTALNVDAAAGLLQNDSDHDTDGLSVSLDSGPSHGLLTLNPDGSFDYTPNGDFVGFDSFTYQVTDGLLVSDPVEVTIELTNTSVTAVNDRFTVIHDRVLDDAASVLSNDIDADADQILSAVLTSDVTHGTLSFNSDGTFVYTPDPLFVGVDSFTYEASDGVSSSSATVDLEVTNSPPVATGRSLSVSHDSTLTLSPEGLLANVFDADNDGLTVSLVSDVTDGTLTLNADGTLVYQPDAGFVGQDSFEFQASDGVSVSDVALVTILVTNSAPAAVNNGYFVSRGATLTIGADLGVLANDSDPDGDSLTASLVSGPSVGTLSEFNSDGSFVFQAPQDYSGEITFDYAASDGAESTEATVTINVINNPPIALPDFYGTLIDEALTVTASEGILANDFDREGDAVTIQLISPPDDGSLNLNQDGSFTYNPFNGFSGDDQFIYRIIDIPPGEPVPPGVDDLWSDPVTVSIRVYTSELVAENNLFQTNHGTELNGTVYWNDFNWGNGSYSITFDTQPQNGTFSGSTDGTFTYLPDTGFVGVDTFAYTLSNGTLTDSAVVQIEVINNAPIAATPSYFVTHGTTLTVNAEDGLVQRSEDPEGDPLTASLVSGPSQGSLSLQVDGSFVYTPTDPDFVGEDSFEITVSDGMSISDIATVNIQITNTSPIGLADRFGVATGELLVVSAAESVLGNDLDSEDDTLAASLLSSTSNGQLIFNADGSFTYFADSDFEGSDVFTYQVTDGIDVSDPITVTIDVTTTLPVALADQYEVTHDQTLVVSIDDGILANDSTASGDSLFAFLQVAPGSGNLVLNSNGSFSYTPDPGFVGTDAFMYRADDGYASSLSTMVTIEVTNQSPLANDDKLMHTQGQVLEIQTSELLANDTDFDLDTLSFELMTSTGSGLLVENGDGTLSYTANAGFTGEDQFSYRVYDGIAFSDSATVVISTENNAPVAQSDRFEVVHDRLFVAAAGRLFVNDNDPEDDSLVALLNTDVEHGVVTLNSDGSFDYLPDPGFTGQDSFWYVASDGIDSSEAARVVLDVVNDAPTVARADFSVEHDQVLTVDAANGILSIATDNEQDSLTIQLLADVNNGALTLNLDGSFVYTPDPGYVGNDGFVFTVSDGLTSSSATVVNINVTNVAPTAGDDVFSFATGTFDSGAETLLQNDRDVDQDVLTIGVQQGPQHGSVVINSDGSFVYTTDPGFVGIDQFAYVIDDGADQSIGNVHLNVTGPGVTNGTAPITGNDYFWIRKRQLADGSFSGRVTSNDRDPNGEPLTATLVGQANQGTVTLNADGTFEYTSTNPGFVGVDSFTYRVSDGVNESGLATVSIDIDNEAPWVSNGVVEVHQAETVEVGSESGLNAYAGDQDGDDLQYVVVEGPTSGSLTWNADGSFNYTPDAGFSGTDSFRYTASDGASTSQIATVVIDVTNEAPEAVDAEYRTQHSEPLIVDDSGLLLYASDIDNDQLTVSLSSNPTSGSVNLNADGTFTYTPLEGFSGTDSFDYVVNDGVTDSYAATVTVTVANEAPEGLDISRSVKHGESITFDLNFWDADDDALTYFLVAQPDHGTVDVDTGGSPQIPGQPVEFTGSVTYTPDEGFTGSDQFQIYASDGIAQSDPITVTIDVTNINPVGGDFYYVLRPGDSISIDADRGLLSRANDGDNDDLTISTASRGTHTLSRGILTVNADGSFVYHANGSGAAAVGQDEFDFTITDGAGTSSTATLTLDVINYAPQIVDQLFRRHVGDFVEGNLQMVDESPAYVIDLASGLGGADLDGDPLTWMLVGSASNGASVTVGSTGVAVVEVPNAAFLGEVTFQYRASDGFAESEARTATLSIENYTPTPTNDFYWTHHGESVQLSSTALLRNDHDLDQDNLFVSLQPGAVSGGTVTELSAGEWVFAPDPGFVGTAILTYTVSEKVMGEVVSVSDPAQVTIEVINEKPWALDRSYQLKPNDGFSFSAIGENQSWDLDGDLAKGNISFELVSKPDWVTVGSTPSGPTGQLSGWTDQVGSYEVIYRLNDGIESSRDIKISLEVVDPLYLVDDDAELGRIHYNPDATLISNPHDGDPVTYVQGFGRSQEVDHPAPNHAPLAVTDGPYRLAPGSSMAGRSLMANDYDPDADSMSVLAGSASSGGVSVTWDTGGHLMITAANSASASGTHSFTYTLVDEHGLTTDGVFTVLVSEYVAPADPGGGLDPAVPVILGLDAIDDFYVWWGCDVHGNVVNNDVIPPPTEYIVTEVSGPSHGSLILNSDGTFVYSVSDGHAFADAKQDTFVYELEHTPTGDKDQATVTIDLRLLKHGGDTQVFYDPVTGCGNGHAVTNTGDNGSGWFYIWFDNQTAHMYAGDGAQANYAAAVIGGAVDVEAEWNDPVDALAMTVADGYVDEVPMIGALRLDVAGYVGTASAVDVIDAEAGDYIGSISAAADVHVVHAQNDIGTVTATSDVFAVHSIFGDVGTVSAASGDVGWVQANDNVDSVSAGRDIGNVIAGLDVTGSVSAGRDIGLAQLYNPDIHEVLPIADFNSYNRELFAFYDLGGVNAGQDVLGSVSAGRTVAIVDAGRDVAGSVSAAQSIFYVRGETRDVTGTVAAAGRNVGAVVAGRDVTGSVTAGTNVFTVRSGRDITGATTAGQSVGGMLAGRDLAGNVNANGGDISKVRAALVPDDLGVTSGNISSSTIHATGSIGSVKVEATDPTTGDISNPTITADSGYIGDVTASGMILATIDAAESVGAVTANFDIDGSIDAGTSVDRVRSEYGSIGASIDAGTDVGPIWAFQDITGTIDGMMIGNVNAELGKVSGDITSLFDVGAVFAGTDIAANIVAVAGAIGPVIAGWRATSGEGNISGNIEAYDNVRLVWAMQTDVPVQWQEEIPVVDAAAIHQQLNQSLNGGNNGLQPLIGSDFDDRPEVADVDGANITGDVTSQAGSIGEVAALGDIQNTISADKRLVVVTAHGDIDSDMSSNEGSTLATASGSIKGSLTTTGSGVAASYDEIGLSMTSHEGQVWADSFESVSGSFEGKHGAYVAARTSVNADKVNSSEGSSGVLSYGSANANLESKQTAAVAALGAYSGKAHSTNKSVLIGALSIAQADINANENYVLKSLGKIEGSAKAATGDGFVIARSSSMKQLVTEGKVWMTVMFEVIKDVIAKEDVYINAKFVNATVVSQAARVGMMVFGADASSGTWVGEKGVAVKAYSDLNATIVSPDGFVAVSATGDITGKLSSQGEEGVTALSWGGIQANISADAGSAYAFSFDDMNGTIEAKQGAALTTWGNANKTVVANEGSAFVLARGDVKESVEAGKDAAVFSLGGNISGDVDAGTFEYGDALVVAGGEPDGGQGDISGDVWAFGSATVDAFGVASGDVTAVVGDALVAALIGSDSQTVTAWIGNAEVHAGGDTTSVDILAGGHAVATGYNVTNATVDAGLDALVLADQQITNGDIDAGGDAIVSGLFGVSQTTIDAFNEAVVFSGGSTDVTVKTTNGDISVLSLDDMTGSANAGKDLWLSVFGALNSVSGSAKSGAASLLVQSSIHSANIDSATGTQVTGLGGVTGNFTSGGDTNVYAGRHFDGTANGHSAFVVANGTISGQVTGTSQDAVAVNTGGAHGYGVQANVAGRQNAFAKATSGSVSGNVTGTYGQAMAVAAESISGEVEAGTFAAGFAVGDISVGGINGSAGALAFALGNISAAVSSFAGTATAVAGKTLSGNVNAGTDAAAFSRTDRVTGTVVAEQGSAFAAGLEGVSGNVNAKIDASAMAIGSISGNVNADLGDAFAISANGSISGSLNAGTDAGAIAYGTISGSVDAGRDAVSSTLGTQLGSVIGGRDAVAIAAGNIEGSVYAGRDAFANGFLRINGNVSAGRDAIAVTGFDITSGVSAGRDAAILSAGSANGFTLVAGRDAFLASVGFTTGVMDAGRDAFFSTLGFTAVTAFAGRDGGGFVGTGYGLRVEAGRDAFVSSFDLYHTGLLQAGRDAAIISGGNINGVHVTAAENAFTWSFGDSISLAVIGDEYAGLISWGQATGPTIVDGDQGAFLWAFEEIYAQVTSAFGPSIMIGYANVRNGIVQAGTDAYVFTVGDFGQDRIVAADDAYVFTLGGFSGRVRAGNDIYLFSEGEIRASDIHAGRDLQVVSYGDVEGDFEADQDLAIETWQDFVGYAWAGQDIGNAGREHFYWDDSYGIWARGDIDGLIIAERNIGGGDDYDYGGYYVGNQHHEGVIFAYGGINAHIYATNSVNDANGGRVESITAVGALGDGDVDGKVWAKEFIGLIRAFGEVGAQLVAPVIVTPVENDVTLLSDYPLPDFPEMVAQQIRDVAEDTYAELQQIRLQVEADRDQLLEDIQANIDATAAELELIRDELDHEAEITREEAERILAEDIAEANEAIADARELARKSAVALEKTIEELKGQIVDARDHTALERDLAYWGAFFAESFLPEADRKMNEAASLVVKAAQEIRTTRLNQLAEAFAEAEQRAKDARPLRKFYRGLLFSGPQGKILSEMVNREAVLDVLENTTINVLKWLEIHEATINRVLAVIGLIFDVIEFKAGLALSGTGVGALLGVPMMAHAVDSMVANARTLWDGKYHRTATSYYIIQNGVQPIVGWMFPDLDDASVAWWSALISDLLEAAITLSVERIAANALRKGALFATRSGTTAGSYYAKAVLQGGTGKAIAGHGLLRPGSGTFRIPVGTMLIAPRHGLKIADVTGRVLESIPLRSLLIQGNRLRGIKARRRLFRKQMDAMGIKNKIIRRRVLNDLEGLRLFRSGSEIANYTVKTPDKLIIFANSITVAESTPLSALLFENMGVMCLATCTKFVY